MDQNKFNIVEIYPEPLILFQSPNSDYLESKLYFHNLTNEYIIFKLYNNQQSLYKAKPSTSFIPPKETVNVLIKRFKREKNITKIETSKDKFLVIFHTINKVITNNEEAKDAFRSKIYKEDSKQENMISIVIEEKNETPEPPTKKKYNIDDINNIGDDYIKGIDIYNDLNEDLKNEINKLNENIKEGEKILEMIKKNKKFQEEKRNALKENKNSKKGDSLNNILLICIILIGLLIGANLANGYHNLFYKSPFNKKEEIVINQSENSMDEKINEPNKKIKRNIDKKCNNLENNMNHEELNIKNSENNNTIINDYSNNNTINEKNNSFVEYKNNNLNNIIIENNNEYNKNKVINNEIIKENKIEEKLEVNKKESIEKGNSNFLSCSFLFSIFLCLIEIII